MDNNARVCIMEWDNGAAWYCWVGFISDKYYEPPVGVYKARFKQDALNWAFRQGNKPVTFIDEIEQKAALTLHIQDLQSRLEDLKKYGFQYPTNPDLNSY